MSKQLMTTMAERFNVPAEQMIHTLKQTCFKGQVTNEQMTALLIVAQQYGLNPWTKEIYAFPDKGGIVPVVGVDGWSRIINGNPAFDGMDFEMAPDGSECTCRIYRKDRSHPISATEYMAECKRSNAGPWQSHPRRMLRHKAMIQCARLAFGFAGIFDQDEAERITEVPGEQEPEDTAERRALMADLMAVANKGSMDDLSAKWAAIGKDARKLVGTSAWANIKAMCEHGDVIQGEAQEVPE